LVIEEELVLLNKFPVILNELGCGSWILEIIFWFIAFIVKE